MKQVKLYWDTSIDKYVSEAELRRNFKIYKDDVCDGEYVTDFKSYIESELQNMGGGLYGTRARVLPIKFVKSKKRI